jgi:hypothetical protein
MPHLMSTIADLAASSPDSEATPRTACMWTKNQHFMWRKRFFYGYWWWIEISHVKYAHLWMLLPSFWPRDDGAHLWMLLPNFWPRDDDAHLWMLLPSFWPRGVFRQKCDGIMRKQQMQGSTRVMVCIPPC